MNRALSEDEPTMDIVPHGDLGEQEINRGSGKNLKRLIHAGRRDWLMTGVSQNGCRKNTLAFLLVHDEHEPHASPTLRPDFFLNPWRAKRFRGSISFSFISLHKFIDNKRVSLSLVTNSGASQAGFTASAHPRCTDASKFT
jgi:hypothetical protein